MNIVLKRVALGALLALVNSFAFAASSRPAAFVSDLHLGAGKTADGRWREIEDFRWQPDFNRFLEEMSLRGSNNVDLVLAGDIFELWQSPTMACSNNPDSPECKVSDCISGDKNLGCNEADAMRRLDYIVKQHPAFIAAIRDFASKGSNHVYFIPGNHDAALLFPGVAGLLRKQFAGVRVNILTEGHWVSPDGLVYSDHGHQADKVNKFIAWPKPFVERAGTRFLSKSWGENMAQEFYNQYEVLYPIIDNLSDELTGARYAMKQGGLGNSVAAAGNFIKFLLVEESLKQGGTALGDGSTEITINYPAVRAKPISFFLQGLASGSDVKQAIQGNPALATVASSDLQLSKAEIDAICTAKIRRGDPEKCPMIETTLGAAVQGAMLAPHVIKATYLREVLPEIRKKTGASFLLYVAGHTHSADDSPDPLKLGDLEHGNTKVNYINTGAFQRLATPAQLAMLLAENKHKGKRPLDLQPEDLPACYNYVWVGPYSTTPVAKLHTWASDAAGLFKTGNGKCLDKP